MNDQFKELLIKNYKNFIVKACFAVVMLLGILILFVLLGIKVSFDPLFPFIISAVFFCVVVYFSIRKDFGSLKGHAFWIKMINENPERIVWIKPIQIKHTIAFAVTIFKERKYQILTNDKITVTIKCKTELENHIFLKVITQKIPWVHIGYSEDIDDIYKSDSKDFIKNLKSRNMYRPISLI